MLFNVDRQTDEQIKEHKEKTPNQKPNRGHKFGFNPKFVNYKPGNVTGSNGGAPDNE